MRRGCFNVNSVVVRAHIGSFTGVRSTKGGGNSKTFGIGTESKLYWTHKYFQSIFTLVYKGIVDFWWK